MKKTVAILLIVMIAMMMSVTAFADPGAFISSPSFNAAPSLIEFQAPENCPAVVEIASYSNRQLLPDEKRIMLENAYSDIASGTDLTKLNSKLAEVAEQTNIAVDKLAVSELFDISYGNCDDHDDHGMITVTIRPATLDKFVGLLHYNGTEWTLIDNAKVGDNGIYLTFSVSEFSPFAIVLNTGDEPVAEEESSNLWVHAAIISVAGIGMGITAFKNRNKLFFSA